jgi:Protein of unknown function (DUF2934)
MITEEFRGARASVLAEANVLQSVQKQGENMADQHVVISMYEPRTTAERVAEGFSESGDARDLTARLAYKFWELRGRPLGSPEVDWFAAEKALVSSPANDEKPKAQRKKSTRSHSAA